jgi:hypothetical protein
MSACNQVLVQVRGFAPTCREPQGRAIGILECWNNGIMGPGKMGCWVNGKICFDDIIKLDNILFKTNIPVFHHSIIP